MNRKLPAPLRRERDEQGVAKTKSKHQATSAERHEQFLVDWSWYRKPVIIGVGIIWCELTVLLFIRAGLVVWETLKLFDGEGGDGGISAITDIELVFAGVFGAWLGLTGTIFKILGPPKRRTSTWWRRHEDRLGGPEDRSHPALTEPRDTPKPEGSEKAEQTDKKEESTNDQETELASLDPEIWKVLLAVANSDVEIGPKDVAGVTKLSLVRVMYYLDQLEGQGFVEDAGYEEEYSYFTTPAGRAYIVKNNLDRDGLPF